MCFCNISVYASFSLHFLFVHISVVWFVSPSQLRSIAVNYIVAECCEGVPGPHGMGCKYQQEVCACL